jgi:hypothetical protein
MHEGVHHAAVPARDLGPRPARVLDLAVDAPLVEGVRAGPVRVHRVQEPHVRVESRAGDPADGRPPAGAPHEPSPLKGIGQRGHDLDLHIADTASDKRTRSE